MNALRNTRHFGMTVPIKHMASRNQNEEESKLRLHFNWKGDDSIWLSELSNEIVKLWYTELVHLIFEELIVGRTEKFYSVEALVFCHDGSD